MTDNNDDFLLLPGLKNSSEFYSLICDAPDFGFWQLTIKDAATLIIRDMLYEEKVVADIDHSRYPTDSELREALSEQFIDFEKRIVVAIDGGSIEATKIRRNLSDQLDTDQTLVLIESIKAWLEERGYSVGDAFHDFTDNEMYDHEQAMKDVFRIRVMRKLKNESSWNLSETKENPDGAGINELRLAVKELTNSNIELMNDKMKLNEKLQGIEKSSSRKTEQKLSTRARRTFLTIIAALCKEAKINYEKRGAAKRISELTEVLGAAVTDDTIHKIISEIEEAVETRMR
jgi:hypothetical protein